MTRPRFRVEDYTVGWVCARPVELAAATGMLDENHGALPRDGVAANLYTLGRIGDHKVVIACLPAGHIGTSSAAAVAAEMQSKFISIRFGLMVGIAGGVPSSDADIRLGDVVVSQPRLQHGGVAQYDLGKTGPSGFTRTGSLDAPPAVLLSALAILQSNHLRRTGNLSVYLSALGHVPDFAYGNAGPDVLFESTYDHVEGPTCDRCSRSRLVERTSRGGQEIAVHYGTVASGNQVMKDGVTRDKISSGLGGVLCFEMEAAGLMNSFPCLVIRGICDYADSHKNKRWQPYAAATAAAVAKEILSVIPAAEVSNTHTMGEAIDDNEDKRTDDGDDENYTFKLNEEHAILEATKWLVDFTRDSLEERVKQVEPYLEKSLLDWFNNRPEFKRWSSDRSSQFLWYARESDPGIISHQVRQLSGNMNAHNQDLAHFLCSPSIPVRRQLVEQPLTSAHVLCSIIAQLLHSDYDLGKDDRLKCINSIHEKQISAAFTSAHSVSARSLFNLLKCLVDAKPNWEIQIVIDSIDHLPQEDCFYFLRQLRHLYNATMGTTEVIIKVLVTSRRTERIQEILKNLPFIDQEAEASECLASLRQNACNLRQMHVSEGQDDTGNWIWKNQAYHDWDIADRSSILWIQGKPGSGKSALSKRILGKFQKEHGVKSHVEIFNEINASADSGKASGLQHKLLKNAEADIKTIIAGFFYNRRGGQTETKHAQMLHSLLFQVLQQDGRLFTSFQEIYRNLRDNSVNTVNWSYEELKTIFLNLATFDRFPLKIYFVIDAMDESDEEERTEILSLLPNARSEQAPCTIKIIIASRPSTDVRTALEDLKNCHQIILENENRGDIKRVVEAGLVPIKEVLGPDFQLVYSYLISNSHGVFLWVELVMRKLKQYVWDGATGEGIRIRLKDIPEDLYPFYSDIIKKLKVRDKYDIAEAMDMLTWVSFTLRPLELREFGDAIAISTVSGIEQLDTAVLHAKRYQNLGHLRKGIKSRSGGLLEVTIPKTLEQQFHFQSKVEPQDLAATEIVQLLHQIVKDFLLTEESATPFNANVAYGDKVIASACVRYLVHSLSYTNFLGTVVKEVSRWELTDYECFVRHLEDRPLLNYALSYLPFHIDRLCTQEDARNLLQSLQRIQERPENYAANGLCKEFRKYDLAANRGLTGVVKSALEAKASVDGFDEKNASTPLVAAAKSGSCDAAKILIEGGASLDLSWEARGTALHAAIAAGDINMVKLFLIHGVNTGARDLGESSAFTIAARAENHNIVRLLTNMGADISARDERGWTALHRIVSEGKSAMVELLIASRVPANAHTNDGLTALHLAEAKQDEEMVNVLLQQERVDPNSKDRDGRTPLLRAIENGHEAIVKLLLGEERVDPNTKDTYGCTPLSRAIRNGHISIVGLLLERAVDVDSKDENGWTPLSWAATYGYEEVVKLLLEKAVNVGSEDKDGRTPLSWAAENGCQVVVGLLLEKTVNADYEDNNVVGLLLEKTVNADSEDNNGRTPLSWAAENGRDAVVKLLLEKAVNVDSEDGNDWTPLSWAARYGYEEVVKLLLEKAVNVDSEDVNGWTPLSWAATYGYEKVVKLLLEKAVNVDSEDKNGWTPLSWAAGNGCEAVVELLLEEAANIDSEDEDGRTPLSWAAENGCQDNDGRTPLSWAAENGRDAVVKLLLGKAVDVDSKGNNGWTPLSFAAMNGQQAVVELLLEKAANVDTEDEDGMTPLSLAALSGYGEVVELLESGTSSTHPPTAGQFPIRRSILDPR
ncbi:MAG: hypothetical protein M1840_001548 [Geoglossum simile]|nr:MAG: hypothetical protein M1840_001548 [Geoglossum simile]